MIGIWLFVIQFVLTIFTMAATINANQQDTPGSKVGAMILALLCMLNLTVAAIL